MNTVQVEEDLRSVCRGVRAGDISLAEFPYQLMAAYQLPAGQIKLMRTRNKDSKDGITVGSKHKAIYQIADKGRVSAKLAERLLSLKPDKKSPRFIIVTDGEQFLAYDRAAGESSSFDALESLPENLSFFQPMFGVERYRPADESTVDKGAAKHMQKLYDAILAGNGAEWRSGRRSHDLNLLVTRLLFCMYAQNTGIFPDNVFSALLHDETASDGADTSKLISEIFVCLDLRKNARDERHGRGSVRRSLPYVNGKLFLEKCAIPAFTRNARRLLIEAAGLKWNEINADIFGSMIQAIAHDELRADLGMHYTSVPNILKVLDPLFLNSLRAELDAAKSNAKALERLIVRISRIRVLDPACGSGNFLIIAYRELRRIETEAFRRLRDQKYKGQLALNDFHTKVRLGSFCGIDPSDFACQTARLSLWISQYQMNRELAEICVNPPASLPLTEAGNVVVGNALQIDWEDICPNAEEGETYVVGNPPYLGRADQTEAQKEDIIHVFSPYGGKFKSLDYVACWFVRGADYIRRGATGAAFVATNSICQGEQVGMLWPHVLGKDIEIGFGHTAFKWSNSAVKKAGVACIIAGIRSKGGRARELYSADKRRIVDNINPYLAAAPNVIVTATPNSKSDKPLMRYGNMPGDGGALLLTPEEREEIIAENKRAKRLIRRVYGSKEMNHNIERYCLWIPDSDLTWAKSIKLIKKRLDACKKMRAASPRSNTYELADQPHRWLIQETGGAKNNVLAIPRTFSERRAYIPISFFPKDTVITSEAFVIFDAPNWLFSVLASRMHMVWTLAVAGRFKTDPRYSSTLVYNTFPLPELSGGQKDSLSGKAQDIVGERQGFLDEGRSLAWLYNPKTMPQSLREMHRELDDEFDAIYNGAPFGSDERRLENLFRRYASTHKDALL